MTKDIDKLKKKLKADLSILKKVSKDKKVHRIAGAAVATALAVGAAVALKNYQKKKKAVAKKKTVKKKTAKKKNPARKRTARKKR